MSATAMNAENTVKKIYLTVIDEVLSNVREAFLDEGYDELLLQELKNMWEGKLNASRALQISNESESSNRNGSASNGGSLRLPVNMAKDASRNNADARSEMDSATRSALQALPQSIYPSSTGSSSAHHQNGKKLHTPQLDGNVDVDILVNEPSVDPTNIPQNKLNKKVKTLHSIQLDGNGDDSDVDDDDDDDIGEVSIHGDEEDDDVDDDKANNDNSEYEGKEDPDPLNSDDDLTEPGSPDSNSDLFDTDNVIVCQYDKITRIKNRWKFHLKDGVMNINGRDYLFSKANGDAEW